MICSMGDPEYIMPGSTEYNDVIGASQVADILGFGWNTAKDLFLKKTHRAPDPEHMRIWDRGHKLEPMMADMLREKGRIVSGEQTQFRDPDRPWLVCHVDAMCPKWSPLTDGATPLHGPGLAEFKAPGSHMADKMHEEGMATGYICQGQIGMHIASAAMGQKISWSTYGFIDYDQWELVTFDCPADEDFQRRSLEKIEEFYDCLQRDVPPEPIFPESLPPLPVIEGTKQIITDGPIPALVESLIRLQDNPVSAADFKIMNDTIREEIRIAMEDIALCEVPGQMRLSYGFGKAGEKISDPFGLLKYCEHLVGRHNVVLNEWGEDYCPEPMPDPITFRRSDWVELVAPKRTLRPTRIDR